MTKLRHCNGCSRDLPETSEYFGSTGAHMRRTCKVCVKVDSHMHALYPQRRQSIPDIKVPAALALRHHGLTFTEIAADLNVTHDAVVSLFADRGIA